MGKIRILSDNLVSKIAAGEIVERPASVVKELIENSIDASSTMIEVEIENGGKRLIRVSDNGEGMTRDESLMSLERHATSKIKDIKDLFSVSTLGFRGEAIPSIASVSRFKVTTISQGEEIGTVINVEGGKIRSVEEIGAPQGTTTEVKNLFYNTPARLKFMRKIETEVTNVLSIVEREAISHPEIGFRLNSDGKTLLHFLARKSIDKRVQEIYPNTNLFPIVASVEEVGVSGLMSSPLDHRSSAQKIFIYVNLRSVKDRLLTRMIINSYGKMLEKGKFPQGALFVEIPPEQVDVNVHPSKNEVRFKNTRLIDGLIKSSITRMLENAPWIKDYHKRVEGAVSNFEQRRYDVTIPHISHLREPKRAVYKNWTDTNAAYERLSQEGANKQNETKPQITINKPKGQDLFKNKGFYSSLKVIGQLGELYIVCASQNGMVLVDQHAAHERINYEKVKKAYAKSGALDAQEMLVPETVEFSPYEAGLIERHGEEIKRLGLRVENFGDNAFIIRSTPAILNNIDCASLLKDIASEIADVGMEKSISERIDRAISTIACHSSIRANQGLDAQKMEALLQGLDHSDFPHSCPHGRPVAREVTFYEIEKMFKRT